MATSFPSSGPRRGRNSYVTLALSGVPNAKRGEKIRIGYLTLAFSGVQKKAELLSNPYLLGGPQRHAQGENEKAELLRNPCILGGPHRQARGEN